MLQDLEQARVGIEEALASCRPLLAEDGGDIELVSVDPTGIVEVRFLGSCAHCSLAIMTLRAGIERAIMNRVPGVRRIEMV